MSLIDLTVKEFVETLASDAPAPGGGSSSALSGALGAGLVSMVCRLTLGKPKYAEYEALVKDTLQKSDALTAELLEAVQKDTNAFDEVMAAFGMPKETEEQKAERSAAIQAAYKVAIASPEAVAEACLAAVHLAKGLLNKSNANAASDLAVGAMQAYAGLMGALDNVQINLPAVKDAVYVAEKKNWMLRVEKEAEELQDFVKNAVAKGIS